jgi:hypothetical protein
MTTFEYTLTSGIFGLVDGAMAVDWMLLNDSDVEQAYRVTAYNCPGYAFKRAVPPGPIEVAGLLPGVSSHYAYGIGDPNPFGGVLALDGLSVEVVVEVNDLRMLPTVEMWSGGGGDTVIAGTRIGPSQFVRLS